MDTIRERIAFLQGSIDAEYDAILDKLPWWQVAVVIGALALSITTLVAVCGAMTVGTGPGGLACIGAMLAVTIAMINWIVALGAGGREATALEEKNDKLEALVGELQG